MKKISILIIFLLAMTTVSGCFNKINNEEVIINEEVANEEVKSDEWIIKNDEVENTEVADEEIKNEEWIIKNDEVVNYVTNDDNWSSDAWEQEAQNWEISETDKIVNTLNEYWEKWDFDEEWVDILYQIIDSLSE